MNQGMAVGLLTQTGIRHRHCRTLYNEHSLRWGEAPVGADIWTIYHVVEDDIRFCAGILITVRFSHLTLPYSQGLIAGGRCLYHAFTASIVFLLGLSSLFSPKRLFLRLPTLF